jgi:hypothetical protein
MAQDTKGQDALYKVGNYFAPEDVKPKVTDPEEITLQDAPTTIREVNRYFKGGAYDFEIFLALLLPAILILLFLIFARKGAGKSIDVEELSDKDYDFIEVVRQQKGLEEFDRDFLLQLSFEHSVKPLYQILIDKDVYEKVEQEFVNEANEQGKHSEADKRIRHLRKLKLKLF